jgi:hypothetical protein
MGWQLVELGLAVVITVIVMIPVVIWRRQEKVWVSQAANRRKIW